MRTRRISRRKKTSRFSLEASKINSQKVPNTSKFLADIIKYFSRFGEIEGVKIVEDKVKDENKGYGFVLFKSGTSAKKALLEGEVQVIKCIKVSMHLMKVSVKTSIIHEEKYTKGDESNIKLEKAETTNFGHDICQLKSKFDKQNQIFNTDDLSTFVMKNDSKDQIEVFQSYIPGALNSKLKKQDSDILLKHRDVLDMIDSDVSNQYVAQTDKKEAICSDPTTRLPRSFLKEADDSKLQGTLRPDNTLEAIFIEDSFFNSEREDRCNHSMFISNAMVPPSESLNLTSLPPQQKKNSRFNSDSFNLF